MEQMAKSAEVATTQPVGHADASIPLVFDGIPFEVYQHFGLDIREASDVKENLKEICHICQGMSIGDMLIRLRNIESIKGLTHRTDKIPQIWRYLKLTRQIEELNKQRASI